MIELCCEYLSVQCICLKVFIMSRTRFRVNPHSIVAWMSRKSLLETGTISEFSGCGFESSCSQLNFRYGACSEPGVSWHPGTCRVWIHSETRTWNDKNTVKCTVQISIHNTMIEHLANFTKWLSVRLRTKLQSLKLQIWCLFRARISLTFRQL